MPERKHFFFGRCSLTNIATGKTLPSIAPSPSPHHSPRSSVKCLSNYSYFFIKDWRHRNGWFEIRLACPVGCCTDEVFLRYFCITQSIIVKLFLLILNKLTVMRTWYPDQCTMWLSPLKSCIKEIYQNAFLCSHFLDISLFQTEYLEIILFPVSLLIYIWVRVEYGQLQMEDLQ